MSRFFWRIFFSGWAIAAATTALTLWGASLMPPAVGYGAPPLEHIVGLVAQDLDRRLEEAPNVPAETLARLSALDISPLLQVFIVDDEGKDVLDRRLPRIADRAAQGLAATGGLQLPPRLAARVHVAEITAEGYRVIGYAGFFPLGRELARLEVRAVLVLSALFVSAVVSLMLARFVVLPVRRLQQAGQQVAEGDLSVRVAPTVGNRSDEIARLAHDFDAMTARVDGLLKARHRLMRDVSHELRSPLARLQALLSLARQRDDADSAQLDRMESELSRLDELIGTILDYSRLEMQADIRRRPTDIVDLLQNIVDDASLEGQPENKQIELTAPARCVMNVDGGLVQGAVENVVRNALKHTAVGSSVEVRVTESPEAVDILIEDAGPGVPPDALGKLFEPFFRVGDGRSTDSGSGGIGLAIAERSVRLHGGTIVASNLATGGLRVVISLPRGPA